MAKPGKPDSASLSALPQTAPAPAPRSEGPRPGRRAKGPPVSRRLTAEGRTAAQVLEQAEWTRRPAKISGADGEVAFKMDDAAAPAAWSQPATDAARPTHSRQ